jgi:hypothetical protein
MEVTMARTTDETADLEEHRIRCGYREPPRELWPSKAPDLAGAEWNAVYDWFEANTDNAHDAILVFIADHAKVSIGEAYMASDGWAKRKFQVDDEGVYCSFN